MHVDFSVSSSISQIRLHDNIQTLKRLENMMKTYFQRKLTNINISVLKKMISFSLQRFMSLTI